MRMRCEMLDDSASRRVPPAPTCHTNSSAIEGMEEESGSELGEIPSTPGRFGWIG